jgi:hypothetical protein
MGLNSRRKDRTLRRRRTYQWGSSRTICGSPLEPHGSLRANWTSLVCHRGGAPVLHPGTTTRHNENTKVFERWDSRAPLKSFADPREDLLLYQKIWEFRQVLEASTRVA